MIEKGHPNVQQKTDARRWRGARVHDRLGANHQYGAAGSGHHGQRRNPKASSAFVRTQLYTGRDIERLEVWLSWRDKDPFVLACDRLLLYIFQTGVVLLIVDLSTRGVPLATVQRFREVFRRAYPSDVQKARFLENMQGC